MYLMNHYNIHYTFFPYKGLYNNLRGPYQWSDPPDGWWQAGWTAEDRAALIMPDEIRDRLLTENQDSFPEIQQIIEAGFKNQLQ